MDFQIIGEIKKIIPIKYGLSIKIRETKIGGVTKNGHVVGTYDYSWYVVAQSEALKRYVQSYFRVGAFVKVKGVVEQSTTKDENSPNLRPPIYKIETIDLWNMGDPLKQKNRERYNSKAIGDETPDINNNFENDF